MSYISKPNLKLAISLFIFNIVAQPSLVQIKEKMAVIISGPNYGMSVTYEDWEIIDEPLFDILCSGKLQKNVPQKFLQRF